jgi:hypothetical protein
MFSMLGIRLCMPFYAKRDPWVERCVLLGLGNLYIIPAAHLPRKGRLSRAQQLTARHHWCLLHQQLDLRTAAGQLTTAAPAARVLFGWM